MCGLFDHPVQLQARPRQLRKELEPRSESNRERILHECCKERPYRGKRRESTDISVAILTRVAGLQDAERRSNCLSASVILIVSAVDAISRSQFMTTL